MKSLALYPCIVAVAIAGLTTPAGADAPANRYTYAASSVTVYDTRTKLTWQRTVLTQTMMWADAQTYCASPGVTTLLGGAGWRVPTVKELQTLIDYAHGIGVPMDAAAFPSPQGGVFWTSTLAAGSTVAAWAVSFSSATANLGGTAAIAHVRCVR